MAYRLSLTRDPSKEVMQMQDSPPGDGGWLKQLVKEAGQAAQAGNAQTARLMALLAVAAAAVAFVLAVTARY
jgi:hypothetical protein